MSSPVSVFTPEESRAIKQSWKALTADGLLPVGLLLFERFFDDVPEVRHMFSGTGIRGDENSPKENFSMETLRENDKFTKHAEGVAAKLSSLVDNLDNTPAVMNICSELGQAHKMYNVKPEYFDRLGGVLLDVLQAAMDVGLDHPTIQAWEKAYEVIAGATKPYL